MRRLLFATSLLLGPAGLALAQAPVPAVPPAPPPAANASPVERGDALERFRNRIGELTQQMERTSKSLRENRSQAERAQGYVNEMLEEAQSFVQMAAPGGDMDREIRRLMQDNLREANEARARGWPDIAGTFDKEVAKNQDQLKSVETMYGNARSMIRSLTEQKEQLAAILRAKLSQQAGAIIDDMLKTYDAANDEFRKLITTLGRGTGS